MGQITLEERLASLSRLRQEPDKTLVRAALTAALGDGNRHMVAKAAAVAGELGVDGVAPALRDAFDRFLEDALRVDQGCVAKTAIARALVALEAPEDDVYLRGVHCRQLEPAYGEPVDTAVPLRAACAEGLLVAGHPRLVIEMVDLMVDPEVRVRATAVRVLASSGRIEAEPLLRLAAHKLDTDPEVVSEVFAGLFAIAPQRALSHVGKFLDATDPVLVESAALALGESRLDEAVPLLRTYCEQCFDPRLRRTVLLTLSSCRREPAFEYLLDQVAEAPPRQASEILSALAIHRDDETLRQRIEEALERRATDGDLRSAYEKEFGAPAA